MKLVDLHPQWLDAGGEGITDSKTGAQVPLRKGVALMFDCPCGTPESVVVIHVNPAMDGGPQRNDPGQACWQRTGDTFETLTLTPSILRRDCCKWHGFVTNGEIRTC